MNENLSPRWCKTLLYLNVLDAILNWWKGRRRLFADILNRPIRKLSRVGQEGKVDQCGSGRRDLKFENQESGGHVLREGRENEKGMAHSGPNEGGKKDKFSWAEKGKWVNDPGPGKKRMRKI